MEQARSWWGMVLRCGLLLAAVPLPARGQPDPTPDPDLVRVARF